MLLLDFFLGNSLSLTMVDEKLDGYVSLDILVIVYKCLANTFLDPATYIANSSGAWHD